MLVSCQKKVVNLILGKLLGPKDLAPKSRNPNQITMKVVEILGVGALISKHFMKFSNQFVAHSCQIL